MRNLFLALTFFTAVSASAQVKLNKVGDVNEYPLKWTFAGPMQIKSCDNKSFYVYQEYSGDKSSLMKLEENFKITKSQDGGSSYPSLDCSLGWINPAWMPKVESNEEIWADYREMGKHHVYVTYSTTRKKIAKEASPKMKIKLVTIGNETVYETGFIEMPNLYVSYVFITKENNIVFVMQSEVLGGYSLYFFDHENNKLKPIEVDQPNKDVYFSFNPKLERDNNDNLYLIGKYSPRTGNEPDGAAFCTLGEDGRTGKVMMIDTKPLVKEGMKKFYPHFLSVRQLAEGKYVVVFENYDINEPCNMYVATVDEQGHATVKTTIYRKWVNLYDHVAHVNTILVNDNLYILYNDNVNNLEKPNTKDVAMYNADVTKGCIMAAKVNIESGKLEKSLLYRPEKGEGDYLLCDNACYQKDSNNFLGMAINKDRKKMRIIDFTLQ